LNRSSTRNTPEKKSNRNSAIGLPELLAVQDDRGMRTAHNSAWPSPADCISVYRKGGPRYRLGKNTSTVKAPFAILISAGTWDEDLQDGDVEGVYALFNGNGMVQNDARMPQSTCVALPGGGVFSAPYIKQISPLEADTLAELFRRIREVDPADQVGGLTRASLLLQAIAVYCRPSARVEGTMVHREAHRLRELIARNAFAEIPLSRLYFELDLSPSRAGQLFGRAFGSTPVEYRNRLRLDKARELLVTTSMNVTRAARAVGIADPLYFSRAFRKRFGVPPSRLIVDFSQTRSSAEEENASNAGPTLHAPE